MADYSDAYARDCECRASVMSPHRVWCTDSPVHAQTEHAKMLGGFKPVYDKDLRVVKHYECLRGCGCLVWDIQAHSENVCTQYGGNNE